MRRLILATGWPGMNSSSVIVCAKGIRCGARPRGEVACRDASDARQNLATTFIFYPHGRLKNHVEGRAVNLERKWGWNPNQLRPTDLPRGLPHLFRPRRLLPPHTRASLSRSVA